MARPNSKVIDMIALIFKAPSRSIPEISQLTGMSRSTVSHYMNGLVEEGVLRAEGKRQKRRFYLCLNQQSPANNTDLTASTPVLTSSP